MSNLSLITLMRYEVTFENRVNQLNSSTTCNFTKTNK